MDTNNTTHTVTRQLAQHLRMFYNGGNWTGVCLRDAVEGLTHDEAIRQTGSRNSIAILVFHITYYVRAITRVLQGNPIEAHDKYSFEAPTVRNNEEWLELCNGAFADGELLATLIEELPDNILNSDFADAKYGSYHRNLLGVIEHCHYHCGQMMLMRKLTVPAPPESQ